MANCTEEASGKNTEIFGWIDETILTLCRDRELIPPVKLLGSILPRFQLYTSFFAIAGDFATILYRKKPRLPNKVVIAFYMKNNEESTELVSQLNREFSQYQNLDFLLPTLPWVKNAIMRAQSNKINFGFAKLPTITPEDVVLAKAFALKLEPNRFQDLDDLKSIFLAKTPLNFNYLFNEFECLELTFPKALSGFLPPERKRFKGNN